MASRKKQLAFTDELIRLQAIQIEDLKAQNNYLRFLISEFRLERIHKAGKLSTPTESEKEYLRQIEVIGGCITKQEMMIRVPQSVVKKRSKKKV